jgi:hypothetical protein
VEGLPLARYPVSKTGAASAVEGSTPSPSAFVPAWSIRYDARLLIARGRFEPCRRSSSFNRRSVSVAARLADNEQGLVRFQDLRLSTCPRGRAAVTPGSQPGSAGSSPAGGFFDPFVWLWGRRPPRRFREPETAGSTPAGQTFDARWRSGFPREPHELETWVRIPPAQSSSWGRSSEARALACQAIGRRFDSGRPRSWWLWCNGKHSRS